jgi:hypothetical protein
MYKHTLSRLSGKEDRNSNKFYRKFLLLAGLNELNAFRSLEQIEDQRYRELIDTLFEQTHDPQGRVGTGTRVHVRSLDMTFMYGFYGPGSESDQYINLHVNEQEIDQAFRQIVKRGKRGVVCGHPARPMAYAQDENGDITDLLEGRLASVSLHSNNHYILAPGALNDGYFMVIGRDAARRATIHLNQFQFDQHREAV